MVSLSALQWNQQNTITSLTLLGMIIGYTCGIIFIPRYFSQVTALKACTILGVLFSLGAILTPITSGIHNTFH